MTSQSTIKHKIIDAIPSHIIEAELTKDRFLRHTNKGGNDIYIVDAFNAPNTLKEIGYAMQNPIDAINVGIASGGNNISTILLNFEIIVMKASCISRGREGAIEKTCLLNRQN